MSTLLAQAGFDAMFQSRAGQQFTIRACRTVEEFDYCVALEQQIWGYPDRELIPRNMFVLAAALGGHVLGAWDEQGALAGFAMAVAAHEANSQAARQTGGLPIPPKAYLHSHMLAVAPSFRDQGLGCGLKLAQRDEALARGITIMRWTFDPLVAKNAFFNLARLGAAAVRYLPDFYGPIESALQGGLPSDRLLVEWNLQQAVALSSRRKPQIAPAGKYRTIALSAAGALRRDEKHRGELATVQRELRAQFLEAFSAGLHVCGFRPHADGGGEYVLLPVNSSEH